MEEAILNFISEFYEDFNFLSLLKIKKKYFQMHCRFCLSFVQSHRECIDSKANIENTEIYDEVF